MPTRSGVGFVGRGRGLSIGGFSGVSAYSRGGGHGGRKSLLPSDVHYVVYKPSGYNGAGIVLKLLARSGNLGFTGICICSGSLRRPGCRFLRGYLSRIGKVNCFPCRRGDSMIDIGSTGRGSVFVFSSVTYSGRSHVQSCFDVKHRGTVSLFCLYRACTHVPGRLVQSGTGLVMLFGRSRVGLGRMCSSRMAASVSFAAFGRLYTVY